ncbi:MAG: helix-turn-helix transcriptional regulator [Gordonia polyisoprenivorans]|nr:helix-turn-helix transcriptional regulator [Gordonia polyisoprenivorans]
MSDDRCELLCLDLPHAEQARDRLARMDRIERRAEQARALGDPTRLRVAAALWVGGEMCVCDLAWVVGQADQLVSHHVRLLRTAGLASSRRQGKLVLYSLTGRGTDLVDAVFDEDVSTSSVAANSAPLAGERS